MAELTLASLDTLDWLINGLVLAGTVAVLVVLWRPAMRKSRTWRGTVTPLASIIGSGFLVVAPLMAHAVGNWALAAMLGIVGLAYAVGAAVRYNILNVESISESQDGRATPERLLVWLERAAKVVLALAYVIAITFYLELLAAFLLQMFSVQHQILQKAIATALVAFIGGFGYLRGLARLESLEKYSVDTKLAIIAGFLVGLVALNLHRLAAGTWSLPVLGVAWNMETLRKLMGAFLIVQGFETSRYMGNVYKAAERAATMRYAQLISAAIYLIFIGLASVLFGSFGSVSETGIITLSAEVAVVMPFLLVLGAATAQFSAAVADTLASGGMVEAATRGRVGHRQVYLAVMVLALVLLWTSHIFEIIAYASRAFAAYYAIQCAMAAWHSALTAAGWRRFTRTLLFASLATVMVLTAIYGIPAESVAG